MFGLAVHPDRIAEHLRRDPLLARALEAHPGLRVPGAWDPFELSVRALLGQQISVRAAQTLAGRLVLALGEPLDREPETFDRETATGGVTEQSLTHLFPTPDAIAKAGAPALQKLGLMPARAQALVGLARAVASGALDFSRLRARPLDEALVGLQAISGFGPWSAHYIALRALGEPDAFPERDLGLLRALQREQPDATFADLRERAEAWRPFRATAAIALWLLDSEMPPVATPEKRSARWKRSR
jgi:AraC family transcriptional regulator of adaptative response / DNA-3-methyladenine glycosylase II